MAHIYESIVVDSGESVLILANPINIDMRDTRLRLSVVRRNDPTDFFGRYTPEPLEVGQHFIITPIPSRENRDLTMLCTRYEVLNRRDVPKAVIKQILQEHYSAVKAHRARYTDLHARHSAELNSIGSEPLLEDVLRDYLAQNIDSQELPSTEKEPLTFEI